MSLFLSAHQSCYLPWMGYFSKIIRADKFLICDDVQFERHGYSNRVQIKTKDGAQWLTIPIEHTGERQLLNDVRIATEHPWTRKHCRAIETAYAKAPHFNRYFGELRDIILTPWTMLVDLNECLLYWALSRLGAKTEILVASDYDFCGTKSEWVLDFCKKLGATDYLFGSQGRDYADLDAFGRAGVLVQFQDYRHPVYPQLHGEFVAGLSVIDLLMNCGNRSLDVIMGRA